MENESIPPMSLHKFPKDSRAPNVSWTLIGERVVVRVEPSAVNSLRSTIAARPEATGPAVDTIHISRIRLSIRGAARLLHPLGDVGWLLLVVVVVPGDNGEVRTDPVGAGGGEVVLYGAV